MQFRCSSASDSAHTTELCMPVKKTLTLEGEMAFPPFSASRRASRLVTRLSSFDQLFGAHYAPTIDPDLSGQTTTLTATTVFTPLRISIIRSGRLDVLEFIRTVTTR